MWGNSDMWDLNEEKYEQLLVKNFENFYSLVVIYDESIYEIKPGHAWF